LRNKKSAKLETIFEMAYLGENVRRVLPFWGYLFNELSKSSLIGEKLPNLVTLVSTIL
jgi:hypothetical protein